MRLKKYMSLAVTTVIITVSACVEDNSSYGGRSIPELVITGKTDSMAVYNINLGDTCVIRPEITYMGTSGNSKELQYEWSIGSYDNNTKGQLSVVSHNRDLEMPFLKGGTYYAHLTVTDGTVGKAMDYRINVNRTFEEGYVLVSNDDRGNGNMAFIKVMSPEETTAGVKPVKLEHCFARMNEGIVIKNLRNVLLASVSWPKTITRLLVSGEDKCYFIDPNTFSAISEINYTDVYPGFKATAVFPDSYSPYAYDASMKKYVHMDLNYMFPYEYKYYLGHTFDNIYPCVYSGFNGETVNPLFINYNPASVNVFNAYSASGFPSSGDLLAKEVIITAFLAPEMDPTTYNLFIYAITRSKADPHKLYLHQMLQQNGKIADSNVYELTVTDDIAVPGQDTQMEASKTYNRYFYPIGNKIYVYIPGSGFALPRKSEYAIAFPDDETITCVTMNASTEELYVATMNTATHRGNFYIFNAGDIKFSNQGHITPKASYKNCADKITHILYKPSLTTN